MQEYHDQDQQVYKIMGMCSVSFTPFTNRNVFQLHSP